MYLWLLAGLLLASPCLTDGDQLLEMSVGARQTVSPGDGLLHAAFITDQNRWEATMLGNEYNLT